MIVFLFLLISFNFLPECAAEYNLATKKEEKIFFSTAKEVKLGRSIAQKVEKEFELSKDAQLQERLEEIGQRLVSVCDRKDIVYCFRTLENEKVNAFSLPGGYVYVNSGLIEEAKSDDELAGVLAHEIGHIVARHSVKRLQAALGYNLISMLALAVTRDVRFKRGADLAFGQIMLGYSREDEFLADELAVKYVQEAGYRPEAVISFLEKLRQIEKEKPLRPLIPNWVRSHPYLPERIAAAKQRVYGKMDFDDYINRENKVDPSPFGLGINSSRNFGTHLGEKMKHKCQICGKQVDDSAGLAHIKAEEYIIELIRKDHPEWDKTKGTCDLCVEYYRELIKRGEI